MKTLKERAKTFMGWRSLWWREDGDKISNVMLVSLDDVQKWLEQKLSNLPKRLEYYHSNDPDQMQTLGKVKALKELLAEISLPAKDSKEGKTP